MSYRLAQEGRWLRRAGNLREKKKLRVWSWVDVFVLCFVFRTGRTMLQSLSSQSNMTETAIPQESLLKATQRTGLLLSHSTAILNIFTSNQKKRKRDCREPISTLRCLRWEMAHYIHSLLLARTQFQPEGKVVFLCPKRENCVTNTY